MITDFLHVLCFAEKITISLQHQCWGEVSICMDGKCGSVCQESLSQVYPDLCKSLQCGEKVVKTSKILPKTNTTIKRLHQTRHTTNLTQSIFVMSEEHDICTPAYVVCSGINNVFSYRLYIHFLFIYLVASLT